MTRPDVDHGVSGAPRGTTLAGRLYRFILRYHPVADPHGPREMQELFEDLYLEARTQRGRIAAWWLAVRAGAEAMGGALRARWNGVRKRDGGRARNGGRSQNGGRTRGGSRDGNGGRNRTGGWRRSGSSRRRAIVENVLQDARYALRTFVASPTVTVVAVVMFALGIGGNTAVFSVVEGVLLRPLPFPEPDRLVDVNWLPPYSFDNNARFAGGGVVPLPVYRAWRQGARSFLDLAVYTSDQPTVTGLGEPEDVPVFAVESNFFRLLGARPRLGRGFLPEEDRPGAPRVVVVSNAFWSTRFGGDPGALGRTVTLDGETYEIVGVMPPGFRVPSFDYPTYAAAMWMPLGLVVEALEGSAGGQGGCFVVGRLGQGMTPTQAEAELDRIASGIERSARFEGWRANVTPLHAWVAGEVRQPLWMLLGAVGLVLLVACSNVANLLLARGAARRREMSIRMAVGATSGRLMAQALVESVLLAVGGGLLGVVLAHRAIPLILSLGAGMIPRADEIGINPGVLGVTLGGTVVAGIIAGCAPALRAASQARAGSLVVVGRGASEGRRLGRATGALVVAQVTLTLMLLAGAGLMVRSLFGLLRIEPGFETEQLVVAEVELPGWLYPQAQLRLAYASRVLEGARGVPGVAEAALSTFAPFESGIISSVSLPDAPELEELPWATFTATTPEYFRVAGIPLLRGSLYGDAAEGPVAVIDQAAAEAYFAGDDPLGRRLATYRFRDAPLTVIGVVGNVHEDSLREEPPPHVYVPLSASPDRWLRVLARTVGDPATAAEALREAVREVDSFVPIERVVPIRTLVSESLQRERFYAVLLGAFATAAILMAAAGIFGVMRYAVSRRTRELGIRVALGARGMDILAMVVGRGLGLAAIGIVLGVLGAAATTRFLSGFLYDLSPFDPLTFVAAAAVLVALSLAASAVPAWRATRVDPVRSLRVD